MPIQWTLCNSYILQMIVVSWTIDLMSVDLSVRHSRPIYGNKATSLHFPIHVLRLSELWTFYDHWSFVQDEAVLMVTVFFSFYCWVKSSPELSDIGSLTSENLRTFRTLKYQKHEMPKGQNTNCLDWPTVLTNTVTYRRPDVWQSTEMESPVSHYSHSVYHSHRDYSCFIPITAHL